jgi:hypothetical protein
MKVETDELITLTNAAERRGVSRQNIASLVSRNKLPVVYIDSVPFVRKQDVDSYEPDPGGRPAKIKEDKDKQSKRKKSRKNSA